MIGRTIGRYQIIDKLGEGGMGAVYKAEDTTLHRLVAIKALSGQLAEHEEARERFVREAQAASALNHPNITTVHDLLEEDDQHFICMEYVDGETIREIVESGPVPVENAIDIILQTAEALEAAHNKGILHRDVKSANIMVTPEGRVKVMDFGLAHLEERSQLTRTGTTMGTLAYSSPEQVSGRQVDQRSEIFSLGVVSYELLTGQLPFKGASEAETILSVISGEPKPISEHTGDVSENLEAVVSQMLEKDPELRYQTCGELVGDLKLIQGQLGTAAVAATEALIKARTRTRKRTAVTAAAVAGAIIGVAALYLLVIAPAGARVPRIAVLPFEKGPQIEDWYADGIPDAIRGRLAAISGLRVTEYYGANQYDASDKSSQQIGNDLDVDYYVRATIQGEQLPDGMTRIYLDPKLIKVSDGTIIWAPTLPLEATGTEIFQLQSDMVTQVTEALGVVLMGSEHAVLEKQPTDNIQAYELYLLGRHHLRTRTQIGSNRAIECFQQAIKQDSSYAEAYAGLADVYFTLPTYGYALPRDAYPKAKTAAEKALELDSSLAEAHTAMASVKRAFEWDWAGAERHFLQAIELNPSYADAHKGFARLLIITGRDTEGRAELRRAEALDPHSAVTTHMIGYHFRFLRDTDQAIAALRKTLELDPTFMFASLQLGAAYYSASMFDESRSAWESLVGAPGFGPEWGRIVEYLFTDDSDNALDALDVWVQQTSLPSDWYIFAGLYAILGDSDSALDWLEKGFEERFPSIQNIAVEPLFDNLRSDERFIDLLERVGLDR